MNKFGKILMALSFGFIIGLLIPKNKETVTTKINGRTYNLEIADTRLERSKGLMKRKELAENQGMLFIFPEIGRHSFWMYNTEIPLDIIWLDQNWNVVHLERDVPPCPNAKPAQCKSYKPNKPSKYVIEISPRRYD